MNHRILRRPRNFAIAVECSAMRGHAKLRCYVFVYTWPSIKTDILLSTVRTARHKLTLELGSGAGELNES